MIKVDTSKTTDKGSLIIEIGDSPIKIATEALALIGCLKAAIKDRGEDYKEGCGEVDALVFETLFLFGLKHVLEDEVKAKGCDIDDIKAADFDSNEEFLKWFRGLDK